MLKPILSRPPHGSVELIFTKLIDHVSLKQCHHKSMGMYGGGLLMFALRSIEPHLFPLSIMPVPPEKSLAQLRCP